MSDHPLRKGEDVTRDELLARLQVIRPTKGDLVVVSVPAGMSMDAQALMMHSLRELQMGVRIVVLTRDLELTLLPPPLATIAQAHYDELHSILAGETAAPPPTDRT